MATSSNSRSEWHARRIPHADAAKMSILIAGLSESNSVLNERVYTQITELQSLLLNGIGVTTFGEVCDMLASISQLQCEAAMNMENVVNEITTTVEQI